jgi:hypothetical protein
MFTVRSVRTEFILAGPTCTEFRSGDKNDLSIGCLNAVYWDTYLETFKNCLNLRNFTSIFDCNNFAFFLGF